MPMTCAAVLAGWWTENWFTISNSVVCLLAGAALNHFFDRLSKRDKAPRFSMRSQNLVRGLSSRVADVSVRFEGYAEPVKNLTVTRVHIWNAGRGTITPADVAADRPIALRVKSGVILSAHKIHEADPSNRFEVICNAERTVATLTFDHIDWREDVIIQVFHTGTGPNDLEVDGKIRGAGKPKRVGAVPLSPGVTLVLGLLAGGLLTELSNRITDTKGDAGLLFVFLVLALLVVGALMGLARRRLRPVGWRKFQKGFGRAADEELD